MTRLKTECRLTICSTYSTTDAADLGMPVVLAGQSDASGTGHQEFILKHRPCRVGAARLILLACVLLSTGCQALPNLGMLLKQEDAKGPIRRALTMWTFSSQEQPDGQFQTGFQGKALFFGEGSDQAQPASGHIEVQVYESVESEWKLRRRFISEGEAWKQNERETALGTVYDIFVPHETQSQQRYALLLILQTKDGNVVKSPVAHLP